MKLSQNAKYLIKNIILEEKNNIDINDNIINNNLKKINSILKENILLYSELENITFIKQNYLHEVNTTFKHGDAAKALLSIKDKQNLKIAGQQKLIPSNKSLSAGGSIKAVRKLRNKASYELSLWEKIKKNWKAIATTAATIGIAGLGAYAYYNLKKPKILNKPLNIEKINEFDLEILVKQQDNFINTFKKIISNYNENSLCLENPKTSDIHGFNQEEINNVLYGTFNKFICKNENEIYYSFKFLIDQYESIKTNELTLKNIKEKLQNLITSEQNTLKNNSDNKEISENLKTINVFLNSISRCQNESIKIKDDISKKIKNKLKKFDDEMNFISNSNTFKLQYNNNNLFSQIYKFYENKIGEYKKNTNLNENYNKKINFLLLENKVLFSKIKCYFSQKLNESNYNFGTTASQLSTIVKNRTHQKKPTVVNQKQVKDNQITQKIKGSISSAKGKRFKEITFWDKIKNNWKQIALTAGSVGLAGLGLYAAYKGYSGRKPDIKNTVVNIKNLDVSNSYEHIKKQIEDIGKYVNDIKYLPLHSQDDIKIIINIHNILVNQKIFLNGLIQDLKSNKKPKDFFSVPENISETIKKIEDLISTVKSIFSNLENTSISRCNTSKFTTEIGRINDNINKIKTELQDLEKQLPAAAKDEILNSLRDYLNVVGKPFEYLPKIPGSIDFKKIVNGMQIEDKSKIMNYQSKLNELDSHVKHKYDLYNKINFYEQVDKFIKTNFNLEKEIKKEFKLEIHDSTYGGGGTSFLLLQPD